MEIKQFKTTDQKDTILAVIYRDDATHPWVVSKVTSYSLSHGEWCNGQYFTTYDVAIQYFDQQG